MAGTWGLRALLGFTIYLGVLGQWGSRVAEEIVDKDARVTMPQLIAEGGGISVESCGGTGDAFDVGHIDVQPSAVAMTVKGKLRRQLAGGMVHAKLSLTKPKKLSTAEHLKYVGAAAFKRSRLGC